MKAKVTVKLYKEKIDFLTEIQKKALELTAEQVLSDIKTRAVVPKDTGELERSGFVDLTSLNDMIIYICFDTPYARKMYWHPEYNFRHDKNANAQGMWMQDYINGARKNFVIESYKKNLKELSKGLIK